MGARQQEKGIGFTQRGAIPLWGIPGKNSVGTLQKGHSPNPEGSPRQHWNPSPQSTWVAMEFKTVSGPFQTTNQYFGLGWHIIWQGLAGEKEFEGPCTFWQTAVEPDHIPQTSAKTI